MPRSSRRRSRKHGSWEERERSDSDEDSRERERRPREEEKAARVSKGSEPEKRLSSALAKPPEAEDNGDASLERRKKRKDRDEEAVAGDDRWNGGGGGGGGREEDDGLSYYDSKEEGSRRADGEKVKKSKNLDADAKEKPSRKRDYSDRHDESGSRKSEKESVLKEDSAQNKVAKERGREHGAEKGKESRHEGSSKDPVRRKEAKARDSEEDRVENKYNGSAADCQVQVELCNGEVEENERHMKRRGHSGGKDKWQGDSKDSKDRQMPLREDHVKTEGYDEERPRDERYKDERSRDEERSREGKYKDERSRDEERPKDRKYKDERPKEEERPRDERYKEERSRNDDRPRDERYKEERSRDEERPRDERYKDERSREKYRDDIYRNQRHQDGRIRDERSSRDNTRDRSSDKHYRDEYSYLESRYNKNKLRDSDDNASAVEERSSKYRDDSRGKKRLYEDNEDDSDLKHRNGKEQRGDTAKRKSEVSSFGSNADRRREYLLQEKVDSRRRDYQQKSSPRSSTFPVREQSRHFSKQEESTTRDYGGVSGRHQRTSDFQSVEEQTKTKANMNESSIPSKDNRSSRSDGQPIHFTDRSPSASERQFSDRSNIRPSQDVDDLLQKNNARQHELPLNRQAIENLPSGSPVHLPPPPDRFEIDSPSVRSSFEEDNRSRIRERRSSSHSRRSGTVNNARGHGNTWKNPPAWASPVPNGFAPFQHGPPLPGFHPAIQQYPPQSLYGIRPPLDMNHAGIPYPLHDPPDRFSGRAQPFPWHNPAEDPYLPRLPGWDASRNVFEEYPHGYDRPEFERNRHTDFNPQSDLGFSTHAPVNKPSPVQFLNRAQREQSNSESSEIKRPDEIIAAKTDAETPPKNKPQRKPAPPSATVDNSQFRYNYFKRLDVSTGLASPELYQKCVTIVGKLDRADSFNHFIRPTLQNTTDEYRAQQKGSNCMIKSLFRGKTNAIFENAMALYRAYTGSTKTKHPISSVRSQGEEAIQQASEDQMEEDNVQVPEEDPALHLTAMRDGEDNDDHPQGGDDLNVAEESGMADNSCKSAIDVQGEQTGANAEEEKACTNNGDKCVPSPGINHGGGCASHVAEEQQVPSINEAELPHDAKDLPPACRNAEGNLTDVAKEQLCGVISDAAFASSSQACEDVMPGCRVNLSRIPCSPGST